MCTRIYPDMVVAIDVIDSARRHAYWVGLDMTKSAGVDIFQSELNKIVISASGCVEWHHFFKNSGLADVLLGFKESEWTVDDYMSYLDSHPDYFVPTKRHPDTYFLNTCKIPEKREDESIDHFLKRCCRRFLHNTAYELQVLEKYGLQR